MINAEIAIMLVISGVVVGFINTLGAGATVISMTVFMAMGLPILDASGTNRIAVLFQNLVSTFSFRKQNLCDFKVAFRLSIPIIIGVLLGAQFSMMVGNDIFTILFSIGLVIMIILIFLKPSLWLKGRDGGEISKTKWFHNVALFLAGIYGGSIYVGVGYFFIAVFVLGLGYDLIKANALKGFMALVTTPFSLFIFILNGHVNYKYGLIHALGNIIGAYIASKYAVRLGTSFIRWLLAVLIVISLLSTLKVIDLSFFLTDFLR